MTLTLDAIFEDGVFKPLSPPAGVAEHDQVRIEVTTRSTTGAPVDVLGSMPQEDAQEMREIIEREFGRVVPSV